MNQEQEQQDLTMEGFTEMRSRKCGMDPMQAFHGMLPRIAEILPDYVKLNTPYIHRQPICCDKENGSVNE